MKKLYFLTLFVLSFAAQSQIVTITDANFKAKLLSASTTNQIAKNSSGNYFKIDENNDGEIQEAEALQVIFLDVKFSNISSLVGIQSFLNLQILNCNNTQLTTLNVSGLTNLKVLHCYNTFLTSINLTGLVNLEGLNCSNSNLGTLDVSNLTNLDSLDCSSSALTSLNVSGLINLKNLKCNTNYLTSLDVSGLNLVNFYCQGNQISSLNLAAMTSLHILSCGSNQLTSLNIDSSLELYIIECAYNQIASLNVAGLSNLITLACNDNPITSLNCTDLINLQTLSCFRTQIDSLDLNNSVNLQNLSCSQIPQLTSLFIKNGSLENSLSFQTNPSLNYICCDENQIQYVQNMIISNGQTCNLNTYCSFVPGGVFYEIKGNAKLDLDNNSCDVNDINYPNLKFSISSGINSGILISNDFGNYTIPVQSGIHTITPVLENPTYFNINPASFVANFPTQSSPLNQDFCVTANGVHHDVEITFIPINPARPGFDANYTIIYKNKGTEVENGTIALDFNDAVLDFMSANPIFSSQATNLLVWNYTNLQPFETRTIDLVFNVNSPTETPAVNIGDFLNYTASITPLTTDEFVSDNTLTLNQTVVGSYDPNDKTCIEGSTVGPDTIGQYVHYVIRFENTGTFAAENIVVKDMIDLTKFDVSTLIPLNSSHDFVTKINGNKVEFIFEGINLPFDDATNDGYVAFKIKTKPNLVVGDTFSNNANIYFDYNFPITTNTFTTTIAALKVKDFDFGSHFTLYPNPVKDVLNIQSKDNLRINSIEIYNTLGQIVLAVPNAISTVDVSSLQSGNYFVKVNTDLGVSNTKFIKE